MEMRERERENRPHGKKWDKREGGVECCRILRAVKEDGKCACRRDCTIWGQQGIKREGVHESTMRVCMKVRLTVVREVMTKVPRNKAIRDGRLLSKKKAVLCNSVFTPMRAHGRRVFWPSLSLRFGGDEFSGQNNTDTKEATTGKTAKRQSTGQPWWQ